MYLIAGTMPVVRVNWPAHAQIHLSVHRKGLLASLRALITSARESNCSYSPATCATRGDWNT